MEEAVPAAEKLLSAGVEVILGGGGTGSLLIQALGQPIIKIARTYLDLLHALMNAKDQGTFIGLTSFSAPTYGLQVYEDLLSLKIRQIVFNTTAQLRDGIAGAINQGVDCIVGGGICRQIALSHGKEGIVVLPSKQVILQALKEARAVAFARRRDKEHTEVLQTILEIIKEGVIVIDADGNFKTFNKTASDIFDIELINGAEKPLSRAIKSSGLHKVLETGKPEIDQVRRVGKVDIVINSLPIEIDGKMHGVVATFKEAQKIQDIDRKVREKLYRKGFVAKYSIDNIKSRNRKMNNLLTRARKYANTEETILIQGETGSGKEYLAHSIHNLSRSKKGPFVAINCSALPESLLESELFGYEEGAFTGARRGGKIGLFELAHGGTIFLDEIAEISQPVQIRLLRVLEEKEVMRIGGGRYVPVAVRIISSSFKDLGEEVRLGRFRRDLFFRLSVLKLNLLPLRERTEDIPLIVHDLLDKHGKGLKKIPHNLIQKLNFYNWPGNIRELDSLIKTYIILLGESAVDEDLLQELLAEFKRDHCVILPQEHGCIYREPPSHMAKPLKDRVANYEKFVIESNLQHFNKKQAARRLGISQNTLWRKLNAAAAID